MSEEEKPKRKISNAEIDNVKNYLVIELSYNMSVLLPYKDGIALLSSLENAEKITMPSYGEKNIIFDRTPLEIKSNIVSQYDYRRHKMNMLLGATDE